MDKKEGILNIDVAFMVKQGIINKLVNTNNVYNKILNYLRCIYYCL